MKLNENFWWGCSVSLRRYFCSCMKTDVILLFSHFFFFFFTSACSSGCCCHWTGRVLKFHLETLKHWRPSLAPSGENSAFPLITWWTTTSCFIMSFLLSAETILHLQHHYSADSHRCYKCLLCSTPGVYRKVWSQHASVAHVCFMLKVCC